MSDFQPVGGSLNRDIRARVRIDFKGVAKGGRFFIGGKSSEKVAEEIREQQVTLFRNVPVQGIAIESIDMGFDVYLTYDDISGTEVAYAPVVLEISADTLEDMITFIARDDFRKIEVVSPTSLALHRMDIERMMFRMAEELKNIRYSLERKYGSR